ncbi:hypothetical protein GK047_10415 [Paenibacillus sp. SYP-B3998]|uniref:Uncharacterized protein n=1 Tax=Paenibacillus sp. SYP-B3998 TaxID=2678564 RepID=A0A6G3ZWB5_9BACL|nr:hypothetical protein [Paenibacillus sp. SYP-B3998]NEW06422.1 hypothetical protein [Paenibacillus sp. SYP-B3998]
MAAILVSGCRHTLTVLDAISTSTAPANEKPQMFAEDNQASELQNYKERQLVLIFQSLIRMDQHIGLAITKEQAVAMLPFVRKSIDEGSLNEIDHKAVMKELTAEQQLFLYQLTKQISNCTMKRNDQLPEEVSSEEREKRIAAFKARRSINDSFDEGRGDPIHGGELSLLDGKALGQSVEKQLIELLEAKQ